MSTPLAFTIEQASRATGVSTRRIRLWDRAGVLSPSVAAGSYRTSFGRIYSFRDLVGLRTLGQLRVRYGLSLQQLRIVGQRLRRQDDAPWSSLRFFVEDGRLYFRDPEAQTVVSAIEPDQVALPFEFDLQEIARETERDAWRLTERSLDQIGVIEQRRHVMSNQPVLAGTRIPTAAIWDFAEAGYDTASILAEYPRLDRRDVERAIEFERERRQLKRAG